MISPKTLFYVCIGIIIGHLLFEFSPILAIIVGGLLIVLLVVLVGLYWIDETYYGD